VPCWSCTVHCKQSVYRGRLPEGANGHAFTAREARRREVDRAENNRAVETAFAAENAAIYATRVAAGMPSGAGPSSSTMSSTVADAQRRWLEIRDRSIAAEVERDSSAAERQRDAEFLERSRPRQMGVMQRAAAHEPATPRRESYVLAPPPSTPPPWTLQLPWPAVSTPAMRLGVPASPSTTPRQIQVTRMPPPGYTGNVWPPPPPPGPPPS